MSIRFQIISIFLLVVSVLLALGGYTASIYRHNLNQKDAIWARARTELAVGHQARDAFEEQRLAWANLILRGQAPDQYYKYLSEFYEKERETRLAAASLMEISGHASRPNQEPLPVTLATQFQESHVTLGKRYRRALKIYNASDDPAFETDRYIWDAVDNPSHLLEAIIDQTDVRQQQEIQLLDNRVKQELRNLWIFAFLVLISSMALLVWFVFRRIGKPLETISQVARSIRDGDLQQRVPQQSADEFGVLAGTLNAMLDRLDNVNRSLAGKLIELQREITKRQKVEASLEARTEELQGMNQELEAFSYTIAHDLRGPLRAITGFSQVLQEDLKGTIDGENQDALDRVSAAGLRMADQIDHILELTRLSREKLIVEDVDLSHMSEDIVQELRDSDPDRELQIEIQPDLHANGDPRLLRVMMENLLGNAWKYTRTKDKPIIRFTAGKENGQIVYRVADSGVGFSMDYAHKLFGAFERLHGVDEFEGMGIGLASVQRVIRRHGGWIRGEAAPGKGAEFIFALERNTEAEASVAQTSEERVVI